MEALEKVMIDACPELMDLTFGCRFKANEEIPFIFYVGRNNGQYALLVPKTSALLLVNKIETENIGHPIQLNHVLRTIRQANAVQNLNPLREEGVTVKYKSNSRNHPLYWEPSVLKMWDLTKDLDGQSEDTKKFLESILLT